MWFICIWLEQGREGGREEGRRKGGRREGGLRGRVGGRGGGYLRTAVYHFSSDTPVHCQSNIWQAKSCKNLRSCHIVNGSVCSSEGQFSV